MPTNPLVDAHQTAKAQFDKLAQSRTMLDHARRELETLTKLGDMVTPEDVIKGAGKLVAEGLSPLALAKLLSDMPSDGQQLQAWVAQHVTALGQREAQLAPVLGAARHDMVTSGLRLLTADHFRTPIEPQQQQGNPLMPGRGTPDAA